MTPFEGHRGGGTFIAPRWVLTAAHCLRDVSDLLARTNRLKPCGDAILRVVSGVDLTAPARAIDAARVVLHPRFRPSTLEYDAALIELSQDAEGAIPIGVDVVASGECGMIAGWGETEASFGVVPELAWARVHVADDETCAAHRWRRLTGKPDLMFAAGGGHAACPQFPGAAAGKGDSGSGFVVRRGGLPKLCGIASWSAPLTEGSAGPQLFTRVCAVADWIALETA